MYGHTTALLHYPYTMVLQMQDGHQAIHIAVKNGHLQVVQYLLEEEGVSPRCPLKVCRMVLALLPGFPTSFGDHTK